MDLHGGNIFNYSDERRKKIIDYSSNINPLGVSSLLKSEISNNFSLLEKYPDPHYRELRESIGVFNDLKKENIVVGNGAVEVLFIYLKVENPKKTMIVSPTFAEYERGLKNIQSELTYFELLEEDDFNIDSKKLIESLDGEELVVLCNPNNPTGKFIELEKIKFLNNELEKRGIKLFIDECFIEFVEGWEDKTAALLKSENIFILRALTKFFAIPGLRLGYGITFNGKIIKDMEKVREPWSVNAFAELGGRVLLNDIEYIDRTYKWILEEKKWFYQELKKNKNIKPYETSTNFILVNLKNIDVDELKEELLKKDFLVRDASNFKFLNKYFVRLAIKDRVNNKKIIEAIELITLKNEKIKSRGFILSGVSSGIGKTTISIGLMNIFKNVSAFKSGPDFIDPTFHSFVTKNNSYNLDLFLMGEDGVKYSFYNHLKDFNIIEGAMGLYDGIDNSLDNYSAAHLSRVLKMPVILVVDGGGKGTSIASQILGYKVFDPRVNIIGIIINKVSSSKTYNLYREAIEKYTGIKCLGYLSKNEEFNIESRHLGLLRANEVDELESKIQKISEELKQNVDIDYIENKCYFESENTDDIFKSYNDKYKGIKMGVARDKAFSFYYKDNLELLEKMGIELKYFSPLTDEKIPEVDFLYFGGGYPENYLEELSFNKNMIQSIQEFQKDNKVILGECGGFMYLTQGIEDLNGKFFKLCSLVDCEIKMNNRLDISRFGYINIDYNGLKGKGHEFHYSKISKLGNMDKKYEVSKIDGRSWSCGYNTKNLLAGYPHLHFFKSIDILEELLRGVEKN